MLACSWSGPSSVLFTGRWKADTSAPASQVWQLLGGRQDHSWESALWVIGCSLIDIYTSRCKSKASCITRDVSHPAITLFAPLVYSRRLRSMWASTTKQAKEYLLPWSHTSVSAHSRWLTALFIILMTKPFSLTIATIHKGNHNPSSHRFLDLEFNLFIIIIWIYGICIL